MFILRSAMKCRCLFSMVLAQKLSTEKKVLYVNLMEHSGMLELLGVPGECDLGEVILALRRQRLTAETLGRGIHETEWMHYVDRLIIRRIWGRWPRGICRN